MSGAQRPRSVVRYLRPTDRNIDAAECIASVLLAITLAQLLGTSNVAWAAFAGFMVMRGHVGDTLLRGALRIVGTIAGGALALAVVPSVAGSLPASSLTLAIAGFATLYPALTAKRSYAWLFAGLTFAMVLLDHQQAPDTVAGAFVRTRILETIAGTTACVVVSLSTTLTVRRRWPAKRSAGQAWLGWHPAAFRHAAQGATALAIVPWTSLLGARELAQAAITIMAAMLVPVGSIGGSGLRPVTRRLLHRMAGCVAGGSLGAAFLLLAHGEAWSLILGTMIAVAIGRLVENSGHTAAYAGTQFALASLMVLVPDSYAAAAATPAFARLAGIVIGIALLEPVLLAWHALAPAATNVNLNVNSEPGDI